MARPTKYKKEYCEKMFDFFNIEHTYEKEITICDKNGNEKTQYIETANQLPTFEKFAVIIGVCRDTLDQWKREHKEFSDTYKMCKSLLQRNIFYTFTLTISANCIHSLIFFITY